jgi:hypothetical protein
VSAFTELGVPLAVVLSVAAGALVFAAALMWLKINEVLSE